MLDTRRITMRFIKDILRLKLEVKHSHQQIANSLGIFKGVVCFYCATLHKQGANIFDCLVAAFKGSPPQPCFA